jgi:hypothetical protein
MGCTASLESQDSWYERREARRTLKAQERTAASQGQHVGKVTSVVAGCESANTSASSRYRPPQPQKSTSWMERHKMAERKYRRDQKKNATGPGSPKIPPLFHPGGRNNAVDYDDDARTHSTILDDDGEYDCDIDAWVTHQSLRTYDDFTMHVRSGDEYPPLPGSLDDVSIPDSPPLRPTSFLVPDAEFPSHPPRRARDDPRHTPDL